jgi:putative PIN family toxin of toxin-antitoxin system
VKVVIDTNIFISSVISNPDTIQALFQACRRGEIQLVLSKPLIQELGRVLHKPKIQRLHRMNDDRISQYLQSLYEGAEWVSGLSLLGVSSDPKDMMVFATALEGQVDYIVSGDQKHVLSLKSFEGIPIVSPKELLLILNRMGEQSKKNAA